MPNDSPDWLAATDVAPLLLGTVTVPAGQASGFANFTVPPTATALLLVFPSSNKVSAWQVRGVTSNALYANVSGLDSNSAMAWCPLVGGLDGQVSVLMVLTGVQGADNLAATVFAYTGAGFAAMFNNANVPVIVKFASTPAVTVSGQPIEVTVSGQPLHTIVDSAAATLPVSSTAAVPTGLTSVRVATALAPNANSTIVAGVAGKMITVYVVAGTIVPQIVGTLGFYEALLRSGTTALPVADGHTRTASAAGALWVPLRADYGDVGGLPLPLGEGLELHGDGSNAGNVEVRATVLYKQV